MLEGLEVKIISVVTARFKARQLTVWLGDLPAIEGNLKDTKVHTKERPETVVPNAPADTEVPNPKIVEAQVDNEFSMEDILR